MRLAFLLLTFSAPAIAAEHAVRFSSPAYFLRPLKEIVITRAGAPGPGKTGYAAVASVASLKEEAKLPDEGPFDIWIVPKDGMPIKALAGFKAKDDAPGVKLNEYLGVIAFRGEGQPRGSLLVTAYDDPGPEGKGHRVVQRAADTRAEMAVPPGDYAVWLVPANGARVRRVVDKVRVHAGKTATAD